EVEQALGDIVQAEEFLVTAIKLADGKPRAAELLVKGVAEARANMQQRKESGRVQAAAVPEAGANEVVVAGRNGLQNVQQANGRFEQRDGATDQARAVAVVGVFECLEGAAKFKSRSLHEQFRALVHDQKCHFIF